MKFVKVLERLSNACGVAGREDEVRDLCGSGHEEIVHDKETHLPQQALRSRRVGIGREKRSTLHDEDVHRIWGVVLKFLVSL